MASVVLQGSKQLYDNPLFVGFISNKPAQVNTN